MDSEETRDEKAIKEMKINMFGKEELSNDETRQLAKKINQDAVQIFDDAINSRWTWGKYKRTLKIFRSIVKRNMSTSDTILFILDNLQNLDETTVLLGKMLTELQKSNEAKTTELNHTLSKLQTQTGNLLNSEAVQLLAKILKDQQEAVEKINKRREKLIRDSIV